MKENRKVMKTYDKLQTDMSNLPYLLSSQDSFKIFFWFSFVVEYFQIGKEKKWPHTRI